MRVFVVWFVAVVGATIGIFIAAADGTSSAPWPFGAIVFSFWPPKPVVCRNASSHYSDNDIIYACSVVIDRLRETGRGSTSQELHDALVFRADAYYRKRYFGPADVDYKEAARLVPSS
jgi:hypothetical protein